MSFPLPNIHPSTLQQRLCVAIQGAVQGVGFRPFIYRLATDLGLVGWVNNSAQGVLIEVEGERSQLDTFLQRIEAEKPPQSCIQSLEFSFQEPIGYRSFTIRHSISGEKTAVIHPDVATCPECLTELLVCEVVSDHSLLNRRYHYPFTNCIHCGPRFSILEALPYDRPNTTMKHFGMCDRCQAEYEDPSNRRFHAQPNACPVCGPHLELWEANGQWLASHDVALEQSVKAIRQGNIVAVKGLGGFQLVADARNEIAVQRLRQAKHRPAKPFALMYPSLELTQAHCHVSDLEAKLLRSPEAPIVLLRRKKGWQQELQKEYLKEYHTNQENIDTEKQQDEEIHFLDLYPASAVAPGNPYLGIMLPYTPLHHLLMANLGFPIVATSGNLADEPICIDEYEALHRLGQIADLFLVHDRPIARPVDDSVVRVVMGREMILRRARGYAPLPMLMDKNSSSVPNPRLLAVGAHLKNTIALLVDRQIFISQHIGNLETTAALESFQQTIADFQQLYDVQPTAIACDLHPDYHSSQFAHQSGVPVIPVQHHYAHVLSCMAENRLTGSVLGIAWDGTGYGLDGTIWGGEFLHLTDVSYQRVAHLRPFRLPGGEKAVKEPRRSAIGLLYELLGDEFFRQSREGYALFSFPVQAFSKQEFSVLATMLRTQLNTPLTSSAGRFFDAIASILGITQFASFEGQAAMALEFAAEASDTAEYYPFQMIESTPGKPWIIDWAVTVQSLLTDQSSGQSINTISAKFHNTLVEMMVAIAKRVKEKQIVLTGGCFQNQYLITRAIQRLQEEDFCPYWHQQIPTNDGGIALGQVMAALREIY